MANTVNVPIITQAQWIEVFGTESTGIMSIAGGGQHCIQDSLPSNNLIGHRFTGEMVTFSLSATEQIYVKVDAPTTVIITQD